MRKSTKIAVVLAAAALLVAGFAFTTLAKGWVKEAEGVFYYEDQYGMKEYNTWEKSGTDYYYLGDDGYMVTNTLVEYEGNYYWCDETGAKVTNKWIKVPADEADMEELDVEYRWYRFDKNGKAITSAKGYKDDEGYQYYFTTDGKMLFGYVDAEGQRMTLTQDDVYVNGQGYPYYCGTNDEGRVQKGVWVKENKTSNYDAYETDTTFWVYYKSNGKRANGIDDPNGTIYKGVRYYFKDFGQMKNGWDVLTDSKATASYFGGADDGKLMKKGWVYALPWDAEDSDNKAGTKKWFYFQNNGVAIDKQGVYKLNGKYYAFADATGANKAGKMLSGIVEVEFTNDITEEGTKVTAVSTSNTKLSDWTKERIENYYFFSNDYANDGSMKKGITFNQEFFDDTYALTLDKTGKLANGLISKRYYKNGVLVKASEDFRYEVKPVWYLDDKNQWKDKYVLVSVSGSEVTKGTFADADGSYFAVLNGNIFKAESSILCPAQAASNFYKAGCKEATFKYDGDYYKVKEGIAKDGYTTLVVEKTVAPTK